MDMSNTNFQITTCIELVKEISNETAIKELTQHIRDDITLIDFSIDVNNLLRFLRCTNYNPENSFKLIKNYRSYIQKNAEIYIEIGGNQPALENNLISISPVRDLQGHRIAIVRIGTWNPKICSLIELHQALITCAEINSMEEMDGLQAIIDMKDLEYKYFITIDFLIFIKKIIYWIEYSFPLRVESFHIINQPSIFNQVYAFFKPFLQEKLHNRIFLHGNNLSSLHKNINKSCLSVEHGGDLPNYNQDNLIKLIKETDNLYKGIRAYAYEYQ